MQSVQDRVGFPLGGEPNVSGNVNGCLGFLLLAEVLDDLPGQVIQAGAELCPFWSGVTSLKPRINQCILYIIINKL